MASGANGTESAYCQSSVTASADTVETRTCAPCHSAVVKSFAENPHAAPIPMDDGKSVTCASCHGSQKAHAVGRRDSSETPDPALDTSRHVDDMCLSCHRGKHSTFERSSHGKSAMSCISCHSIHSAGAPEHLLKEAQITLCYRCHADIKSQFSNSSRHKVAEGLIECTDCHDPHGTDGEERPWSAHPRDTFCIDCHAQIAGPFAFEHAVVKTEGCVACHFPHGGANPHLLLRADVDAICRQCHLPPPDPKTGAHMQLENGHAEDPRPCTSCHTDIHGSNSHPMFLREK